MQPLPGAGDIAFLATTNGTKADIVYSNLKVYPSRLV